MKKIAACLIVFPVVVCFTVTFLPAKSMQAAGLQIEDIKLGKDVKDRMIADETAEFAVNDKVYLWVKVTGAGGEALKVTWTSGSHTYTSDLAVGGSPWRTWCFKTAAVAGDWTATVTDSKGNTLKELKFKVK